MSGVDPSAAVAKQTKLAAEIFDELYKKTFDGVGVTRASYGCLLYTSDAADE